ncbi:MAG: hypothetical protein R3308_09310 [Thiohalobacterales bacterium]|nr:hypothetical protein [Thiohalobacterales bacterium]
MQQLDQGLRSVRADINRIDTELNRASVALHANRHAQAKSLRELAKIRLDALVRETFMGELEAADQRALALLDERARAYEKLEGDIARAAQALADLEQARSAQQDAVSERSQAIIDCEQRIQGELEEDPAYQQQLQEARRLDSIAAEAERKAGQAAADRAEKGRSFEENELFMYLWKRSYGTPEYQAGPLTRFLDAWVERLCNYNEYRVNYWTLLEIPVRLQSHAEGARTRAQSALDDLAALEIARAETAGLPALQAAHADAQGVLDDIDDRIEQQEAAQDKLLQQRTAFAEARDTYMVQGLEALSASLSNKSLLELNDAAHDTADEQDNRLVRELAELRERHKDLEEELNDHRRMHESKLDRLKEFEQVRRRFKRRRFDDLRSGFGNEGLITAMLGQFMNGLVNSDELWRVLERHQRHRDVGAWPDFGSGGLGLPGPGRSPWHFPRGRGASRGGFRLPRTGGWRSRGRGGFRTGGGF